MRHKFGCSDVLIRPSDSWTISAFVIKWYPQNRHSTSHRPSKSPRNISYQSFYHSCTGESLWWDQSGDRRHIAHTEDQTVARGMQRLHGQSHTESPVRRLGHCERDAWMQICHETAEPLFEWHHSYCACSGLKVSSWKCFLELEESKEASLLLPPPLHGQAKRERTSSTEQVAFGDLLLLLVIYRKGQV